MLRDVENQTCYRYTFILTVYSWLEVIRKRLIFSKIKYKQKFYENLGKLSYLLGTMFVSSHKEIILIYNARL